MRRPRALAVLFVSLAVLSGVALLGRQARPVSDRDRFIGAWRLVSLEGPAADGTGRTRDVTGLFVFTREGRLGVQVMDRSPDATPHAGPEQYAQGGYEATFGRFDVDEAAHTFTYHVEGSLVRALVGKALPRAYAFSGSRLVITSTNPAERWRAVWEHY
jgi:hypothetical protein